MRCLPAFARRPPPSPSQRVDENLDEANFNMREGHAQLQRYWRNMSSSRGLMMRVFAILLFFVVVWGTLFA